MTAEALRKVIDEKSAKIGVIGCGYVGLPLAVAYAKAGYSVVGVDVDPERVRRLCAGESYIQDIPSKVLAAEVKAGRFTATTDYAALRKANIIFVAVPTPFDRAKQPDLRYVTQAAEGIAAILQKGHARRPREHDLSRNHGRGDAADSRALGPARGRRLLSRLFARTD